MEFINRRSRFVEIPSNPQTYARSVHSVCMYFVCKKSVFIAPLVV